MKLLNRLMLTGAFCAALAGAPATAQTVADAINGGANPIDATWSANNVGWYYTPTTSYTLTGFSTRFASTDGRTIGQSFYSGTVGNLTLLGSGTLVAGTTYTPSTFTSVALTAGTQYFFAFNGVAGLGVNVTGDAGATNLPGGLRYDFAAAPTYELGPETGVTAQPIVQFYSAAPGAVPEPATWGMMILGFGAIGVGLRRRKSAVRTSVRFA